MYYIAKGWKEEYEVHLAEKTRLHQYYQGQKETMTTKYQEEMRNEYRKYQEWCLRAVDKFSKLLKRHVSINFLIAQ